MDLIITPKFLERFHGKYIPDKESGCWLWKGSKNHNGYGEVSYKHCHSKRALAHRVSWAIHQGKIPDGLCVLHKCDVRNCVNPDHLFLGTQQDNLRDCYQKGRMRGWIKPGQKSIKIQPPGSSEVVCIGCGVKFMKTNVNIRVYPRHYCNKACLYKNRARNNPRPKPQTSTQPFQA